MVRVSTISLPRALARQPGKRVCFMGYQRQQHYLDAFEKLEPKAQKALKDIYIQAHKGQKEMGRHVVMAMVAAVQHPDLFRFTLSNIVVRLMLKRFQINGEPEKALHMQGVLDDFHMALDAFMGVSRLVPTEQVRRNEAAAMHPLPTDDAEALESEENLIAILDKPRPEVVRDIRKFKYKAGPSITRAKRTFKQ